MAIHCAIIHENHTQAMSTVPKTPSLVDSGLCDKSRCLLLRCIVPVCWLDWSRYWAGILKKLLVQQIWVTSTNTEVTGACWGHVLSIDYAVCYWSTWPRRIQSYFPSYQLFTPSSVLIPWMCLILVHGFSVSHQRKKPSRGCIGDCPISVYFHLLSPLLDSLCTTRYSKWSGFA